MFQASPIITNQLIIYKFLGMSKKQQTRLGRCRRKQAYIHLLTLYYITRLLAFSIPGLANISSNDIALGYQSLLGF